MDTVNKIITNIEELRRPCAPVGLDEGIEIGEELIKVLDEHESGVGLAANQIGINKRVCVVKVKKPLILINPVIISGFDKIHFNESCLSFMREVVVTERFKNVFVSADNYQNKMAFYGNNQLNLLESVCIQHEIDHLNGLTMHDRGVTDG